QDAAVRVAEAGVAAAGDSEVRVARLARPVDRAAEDGDLEVLRIRSEPLLDLLGERLHADVVASARRARDHDRPALAEAERLEDLVWRLLLEKKKSQRKSNRRSTTV